MPKLTTDSLKGDDPIPATTEERLFGRQHYTKAAAQPIPGMGPRTGPMTGAERQEKFRAERQRAHDTLHTDHGHTVERCQSGLGAASALSTIPSERKTWEARMHYWEVQLKFAQERPGDAPTAPP